MNDEKCVAFLQWALPQLRMRWPGFKRVHKQVCRRIADRILTLHLEGPSAYRTYLADNPEEWKELDSFCRITISRFYRDRGVFQFLQDVVLRELASGTESEKLRCWCCGCAAGEEPYTLSLIWQHNLKTDYPEKDFEIVATDSMKTMLNRARTGRYGQSSMKELPEELLKNGFIRHEKWYDLKDAYRDPVRLLKQDVRKIMPKGPFQLILCRYLVFTYFDEKLQTELMEKIVSRLAPGGALVLGKIDRLPTETVHLETWSKRDNVYRKVV